LYKKEIAERLAQEDFDEDDYDIELDFSVKESMLIP